MIAVTPKECLLADVCAIVRKTAKVPPNITIDATSRLVEDLAIDSLDLIHLILHVQDRFEIVIEEDAVANLCRVADLAAYLSERRESNSSGSSRTGAA
jgi:acyl carrier protein